MKRPLILVIVLCLVIPSSLVVDASNSSSDSYSSAYTEAVINGIPLTSNEFLVYYMTRAIEMGLVIKKDAIVFDSGMMVSYNKAFLTLGDNNRILIAAYMLPDKLKKSDPEYLWLVSFVAAFLDPPSFDEMYEKVTPAKHYLITAPEIIEAALSVNRDNMLIVDEYGFFYDDYEGLRTLNAEFVGRKRDK